MRLFKQLKRQFRRPKAPTKFTAGDRGKPGIPGAPEDIIDGKRVQAPPAGTPDEQRATRRIWNLVKAPTTVKPTPESAAPPQHSAFGGMTQEERQILGSPLDRSVYENLSTLQTMFHSPKNADIITREFDVQCRQKSIKAALMYIEGIVDTTTIRINILQRLMDLNTWNQMDRVTIEDVRQKLVSETQVRTGTLVTHAVSAITAGECVLMLDGDDSVLIADTRMYPQRDISESQNETVVRGPHYGFVEDFRTNVALIRAHMPTPQLVIERHAVGARGQLLVGLAYLEGVANPKIVSEVRRRISSVSVDYLPSGALLRHFIVENVFTPFPSTIVTERPDRLTSMVSEGHIAIVYNAPGMMVVPVTLWALMQSPEDYYLNWMVAGFLRISRWVAFFLTLYGSALYVAISTYHPEMIPTELMLSMAAARETVPFPAALEVALMEGSFELIREAGLRVPTIIGPTIGIVGAVILGQAAVQAGVVSPILVVIVALTGLGNFAIPDYDLGLLIRVLKFVLIGVAAVLGVPGLTVFSAVLLAYLFTIRSFGVPVTAPLIPNWKHSADTILRGPVPSMRFRPGHTRPVDGTRQPEQSKPTMSLERNEGRQNDE